jgi:hypothetical protein
VALLLLSLIAGTALGGALVGVDWVPAGRADLAWVDDDQLTGTLVGEYDGLLVPPLTAWAGVAGSRYALLGGLAAAWASTTTWSGDQATRALLAALRPSADLRRYLRPRADGEATPWLQAGAYTVLPAALYTSDTWTEEEQADMDETAAADRARIGGVGVRLGAGAEVAWTSGLCVGARYLLVAHRSASTSGDAATASALIRGEAALVLAFAL